MTTSSSFFDSSSGTGKIYWQEWKPDEAPRAVLQIAHGICEHSGRYDAFARHMAENGILVVASDHLGHGRSATDADSLGFFTDSDGWNHVVRDLLKLFELTKERYPDLPYFMMGHSMGSFLTRTFLIEYPGKLTGAILSGTGHVPLPITWFGGIASAFERARLGKMGRSKRLNDLCFGTYNRSFRPNRTEYDWISSDPASVDVYLADPLCGYTPCVSLFRDLMFGLRFISKPKNLKKMQKDLPVYLFSGSDDPVGDHSRGVSHVFALFKQAGMTDVSLHFYPGGRHEMISESNFREVFADVLHWINEKRT